MQLITIQFRSLSLISVIEISKQVKLKELRTALIIPDDVTKDPLNVKSFKFIELLKHLTDLSNTKGLSRTNFLIYFRAFF